MEINIFGRKGLLTDQERKMPLEHGCSHFSFKACMDLSEPVQVIPYGNGGKYTLDWYSQDLASFMCWWTNFVMKDLNGFSGFSHVRFQPVGFEIVDNSITK